MKDYENKIIEIINIKDRKGKLLKLKDIIMLLIVAVPITVLTIGFVVNTLVFILAAVGISVTFLLASKLVMDLIAKKDKKYQNILDEIDDQINYQVDNDNIIYHDEYVYPNGKTECRFYTNGDIDYYETKYEYKNNSYQKRLERRHH